MKKPSTILALLFLFFSASCALFKKPPRPYPTGLQFPLVEDGGITVAPASNDLIRGHDGKVYLAEYTGSVVCLESLSRQILWNYKADDPFAFPPVVGDTALYISDENNVLHVLDFDGRLLFQKNLGGPITAGPKEKDGKILVGIGGGRLLALDPQSAGSQIWEFQAEGNIRTAPVFAAGRVVFGTDDGHVHGLDTQGRPVWTYLARGAITNSAVAAGSRVYFGTDERYVYCLDAVKGKKKWAFRLGGVPLWPPLVVDRKLVFTAGNSVVYCLRGKTGEIVWWDSVPSRILYAPELAGDRILVSSSSTEITAYDIHTGNPSGSFKASGDLVAGALWLDPHILILRKSGDAIEKKAEFLKKEVRLDISSSRSPPQRQGEPIEFQASAVGFHLPSFELTVFDEERRPVFQKASADGVWLWIPDVPGIFRIHVRAVDAKQECESEMIFSIEKRSGKT